MSADNAIESALQRACAALDDAWIAVRKELPQHLAIETLIREVIPHAISWNDRRVLRLMADAAHAKGLISVESCARLKLEIDQ